jgi:hypothetical protein
MPPALRRPAFVWTGGLFTHNSREVIVGQVMLDASEGMLGAVVVGESEEATAYLDLLCKHIDTFNLLDPLQDAEKRVQYNTIGRAKLGLSPTVFLSKDYIDFLETKSKLFETEHYDVELQPINVGVAVILKPNLSRISKMSLDVTEMTDIMRGMGSREIQLQIASVEDYANRIYSFSLRFDSETAKSILTDLEKHFSKS